MLVAAEKISLKHSRSFALLQGVVQGAKETHITVENTCVLAYFASVSLEGNLVCGYLHYFLADTTVLSTGYMLWYLPHQEHSASCKLSLVVLLRLSLNVFSAFLLTACFCKFVV